MSRRARLLPLLAALIMVLPIGVMGQTRYFCRSMDRVMEACCCRTKADGSNRERTAEIRRTGCCEVLRATVREAAPAPRLAAFDFAPIALLATLSISEWLLVPARASSGEGEGTHRLSSGAGPPLYIENCALLT